MFDFNTLFGTSNDLSTAPPPSLSVDATPSDTDTGGTYKVPYTTILTLTPHPNAERLEVAKVYDFRIIVRKGQYQPGDKVVLVPVDSVPPQWLEDRLFPSDAKVKLNNHRVRQIRIRGLASQDTPVALEDVSDHLNLKTVALETDLKTFLGITKYTPPAKGPAWTFGTSKNRNRKHEHPLFHKYNGVENIKWFPDMFKEGETYVIVTEKLHGTNARASILPFRPNTLFKRVLKLLHLAPKSEKCYGSNMVQKSVETNKQHFYGEDIWGNVFEKIDVFSKLKLGEIVYGEIVGPGIQANYDYGLLTHRFVVFDVKILRADDTLHWLKPEEVETWCKERGFEHVPVLYRGKYSRSVA